MTLAIDTSEHVAIYRHAVDGVEIKLSSDEEKAVRPGASLYLPHGFLEWMCQDASEDQDGNPKPQTFSPPDKVRAQEVIAEWCLTKAVLPVRISRTPHRAGSGYLFVRKNRSVHERTKTVTWFYDEPDPDAPEPWHRQPGPLKNLQNGMPQRLWCRLYGVNESTAQKLKAKHGFKKLDKVDHEGAE